MENTAQTGQKRRGRPPAKAKEVLAAAPELPIDQPNVIDRGSMRPNMREDDPRAAAARRAAEIRSNYQVADEGVDEFKLPPAPPGWTYEWKTKSVMGQEQSSHITELYRQGWEEVPTNRHPEEMPLSGNYPVIERKGMVLMQRPTVIVEEARAAQLAKAKNQVRVKETQLSSAPEGQFERNHRDVRPQIKKGFEPIPVPKE